MTTTLSVIGLVTRLRSTTHTVNGDALYREKISNQTYTFTFKQFVSARHEYNEHFGEGDLVLFGGKFTTDQEKLMVSNIAFLKLKYHKKLKLSFIFFCVWIASRRNGLYIGSKSGTKWRKFKVGSNADSCNKTICKYNNVCRRALNFL